MLAGEDDGKGVGEVRQLLSPSRNLLVIYISPLPVTGLSSPAQVNIKQDCLILGWDVDMRGGADECPLFPPGDKFSSKRCPTRELGA
jgi:hypothetical protein